MERVELVRWFSEVGEPAYPVLLELCEDSRPDVAGAALGALGATGDSRLVEELHALPWPGEESVLSFRPSLCEAMMSFRTKHP